MSVDFVALIQKQIVSTLGQYATTQLGATPTIANKAVSLIVPALLAKLGSSGSNASALTTLMGVLQNSDLPAEAVAVSPEFVEQGKGLLGTVFGDISPMANLLAGKTGLSTGNTKTMLAAAAPMVLGFLSAYVKNNKLDGAQLMGLLGEQHGAIERVLGADLLGMLNWSAASLTSKRHDAGAAVTVGEVSSKAQVASAAEKPVAVVATSAASNTAGGGLKWLWLVLTAAVAFGGYKYWNSQKAVAPTVGVASTAGPAASAVVSAASATASAPASVAEVASSAAVQPASAASAVDAPMAADAVTYSNGVLSVYFATGKTVVNKANADVVSADIVAQGKAGKKLVVAGFNDPRGNAAQNAQLAKSRAQAVQAYLISKGVAASQIELRKPVQTSGAGANLAQERRVDVTVE